MNLRIEKLTFLSKLFRSATNSSETGMTILELMIVLVILSLIAVVGTVQVVQQMDRAKVDVARLQIQQVVGALELFQLDNGRYPTVDEGAAALIVAPADLAGWRGPYVKGEAQLADPWGAPLFYRLSGATGFEMGSLGSDGKEGGSGAAADITYQGGL